MMPLWTSGVGSLAAALSFMFHDHTQPQVLHVVAIDLRERAVVPGLIVAADHQPVARDRVCRSISSVTGT